MMRYTNNVHVNAMAFDLERIRAARLSELIKSGGRVGGFLIAICFGVLAPGFVIVWEIFN